MELNLRVLEDAILQLEEALRYCESELVKTDPRLFLHLRAGAIQAFEFTYELSHKMLKRYLELTEADPSSVDKMTFKTMIRRGYELGLLSEEVSQWERFRQERGTTSHAYDGEKAQDVYRNIPRFLTEARYLLLQLQERKDI